MTNNEAQYCTQISKKDESLRDFLRSQTLSSPMDEKSWFEYVEGMKNILGNISNDLGFLATLIAKKYLNKRFKLKDFDAAEKPQGAPGPDIEVLTTDGRRVYCEIKTTRPYQPGFGAQQKNEIKKDLKKLSESSAHHKLMLVTNNEAFKTLCKPYYAALSKNIEIVNLLTEETFFHKDSQSI